MGVSVICLLFPPRLEEENLRGRTKGGKSRYFERRIEESDYPSSFRPRLLPLFLVSIPHSLSLLYLSYTHIYPYELSLFLWFHLCLCLCFSLFLVRLVSRRTHGYGGGGGSGNVWKMSDETLKQTGRQPAPRTRFDVSETGRRRPVRKVTVIDNFLIASDSSRRFKLAEPCKSGLWRMIHFKMP